MTRAFAQYLFGTGISAKLHPTRKNKRNRQTFQTDIMVETFNPIYGRVNFYNNSFIPYTTVTQWNLLPREPLNMKCKNHFTNALTKYLK